MSRRRRPFYSRVLGGTLVHEISGFVEYRIEDIVVGLAEQPGGWTGPEDEYPHYAFYIKGPNFDLMKQWFDGFGVPNYPWRRDNTALMYFRHPSGNLFEMYCPSLKEAANFVRVAKKGGSYAIDFPALNYDWKG